MISRAAFSRQLLVLLPTLLVWFDGKLNGEVIRLNVNAYDMGGDDVLVVE
jgi:hypothetical protein